MASWSTPPVTWKPALPASQAASMEGVLARLLKRLFDWKPRSRRRHIQQAELHTIRPPAERLPILPPLLLVGIPR